ncbi:TRAM domain-containing protein [Salinigranum halophilum]|jgi:predicted RNA-binding protein with TRAM domain|uniref:TRAM domain-containing protein n=1 Tax=Salinigranum halophilum TaxID=2565931 RepID=UPI0010A93D28|nr:TRAM domain-containing protein [Salinigranum halophilum]
MPDCPLADECPRFSERIAGMGCQYFGDKGGAEWCDSYNMPIYELKQQPVKAGEEIEIEVTDIHESGAGVGRTDDGFIVLVDGLLPECRAIVRIDRVKSNHALAKKVIEKMPLEADDEADETSESDTGPERGGRRGGRNRREALGSRDNFWGK